MLRFAVLFILFAVCASLASAQRGSRADGTYFVPVDGQLVPEASFSIRDVRLDLGRKARLQYDLPATLVGGSGARVDLRGELDPATGAYELRGDAGFASCVAIPGGGHSCAELLPGIRVDVHGAREAIARVVSDPAELERRVAVATAFSVEPIGVLITEARGR